MAQRLVKQIEISPSIISITQKIRNVVALREKIKESLNKSTSEILETILGGAINLEASDIHIEPKEKLVRIRVRLDGILQNVTDLDFETYQSLLSRIKILSGIKLNIINRPQDGRFSIIDKKHIIEIRTSTLPSEYGESLVLRILDPKRLISIEELGLRKDLLDIFKKQIREPNGMIIVTGPTGSGKTTTLYAFLKKIQRPEIKIITIEDPIEYHLEEITQTQVNPKKGYDFASGLKSIMRQDPDVILVGEIRDAETAKIAIQAALTGHLVLTTLHTNDAAGTITRLVNLGAKPINIGPAINLAIAQRLVRKVCNKCTRFKKPSTEDLSKLKEGLKEIPKKIKLPDLKNVKIPIPKGCKDCNYTGYRDRIGIFEAILIDDEMERFILENPSISALREKAKKRGMVTMKEDGLIKVIEGITTIEEVERVTGE